MTSVFRRGDLRLFLLGALEDGAKHGYEIMRLLEDRFAGLYRPSAGSIYPRLARLVHAGLVAQDGRDYSLTDAGRAEVVERRAELKALEKRIGSGGNRRSGTALRAEIRAAAAEVRSQQRRLNRERSASTRGDTLGGLRVELRVFSADVLAAARRANPDQAAVTRVLRELDKARAAALEALASP